MQNSADHLRSSNTDRRSIVVWAWWAWPVLAVLLIAAAAVERRSTASEPGDATAYHARVADLARAFDLSIGPWVARRVEVPPPAVKLLNPNTILSLRYENVATGDVADLLFVQVRDARDLIGHYPPNCYPSQGWELANRQPLATPTQLTQWPAWTVDPVRTRYRFTRSTDSGIDREIVIDNLMLLPGVGVRPDMDAVDTAARDQQRKFLGAAQLQIITDAGMDEPVRQDILQRLLRSAGELATAVGEPLDHKTTTAGA